MTALHDVWLVEYQEKSEEFGEEKTAADFQDGLSHQGIDSQLSHEKHVLMKIPYRWLKGEQNVGQG